MHMDIQLCKRVNTPNPCVQVSTIFREGAHFQGHLQVCAGALC